MYRSNMIINDSLCYYRVIYTISTKCLMTEDVIRIIFKLIIEDIYDGIVIELLHAKLTATILYDV